MEEKHNNKALFTKMLVLYLLLVIVVGGAMLASTIKTQVVDGDMWRAKAKDREEIWKGIMDRYDAGVDYSGFEAVRNNLWQKQLHLFECPFYYIEYGIAQLGALQVWANFKKDPKKAIDDLFRAESLGDSRPLPELFATANIGLCDGMYSIPPPPEFITCRSLKKLCTAPSPKNSPSPLTILAPLPKSLTTSEPPGTADRATCLSVRIVIVRGLTGNIKSL